MAAQADGKVGDHAAPDKLLLHELPRERDRLPIFKLDRQRQLDLTRQLRVAASFGGFGGVPQFLTIAHPRRRVRRQYDCCKRWRAAALIRMDLQAPPPVVELFPAAARGYRDRALSSAAAHDSYAEVIDRHAYHRSPRGTLAQGYEAIHRCALPLRFAPLP